MFSRLPAAVGNPPVKVVFEGVEPGSAAAQQLYHENQAAISHFHSKARQSVGDRDVAYMQQALAGEGQLRYSFNNGQEAIHVKLETEKINETVEEKKSLEPWQAMIAIDVVFDTRAYNILHSYSATLDNDIQYNVLNDDYSHNTLAMVGMIADPDADVPVSAVSAPGFSRSDSPTLQPVTGTPDPEEDPRVVAYTPDPLVGMSVIGFVAYPRTPMKDGAPLKIDVYLAAFNPLIVRDEEDVTITYDQILTCKICVREYLNPAPISAVTTVRYGRRVTGSQHADDPAHEGEFPFPESYDLSQDMPEVLTHEWAFAVDAGWVPTPGVLADPGALGMGELLAESPTITTTAAAPETGDVNYDPGELFVFLDNGGMVPTGVIPIGVDPQAPITWEGDVEDMTLIARIEWTPPVREGGKGTAKITPA